MPKGRASAVGLVLVALCCGCVVEKQEPVQIPPPETPACEQPKPPAPLPVIHVSWQLRVFKPGSSEIAGTIDAGSVSGGAVEHAIREAGIAVKSTHKRTESLVVTPVTVHDASSAETAALHDWYAQTLALLDKCPADQEDAGACDPHDLWLRAGLTRNLELSARTDDGQVLATWKLSGAFLAEAATAASGNAVASARFAPDLATFSSFSLGNLPGSPPAAEVALAKAGAVYTPEELNAFASRYRAPEEWLADLNRSAAGQALYVERSASRCEGEAAAKRDVCPVSEAGARRRPADYVPAHNFKLELDGASAGGFKAVAGLATELEVIEYKDGEDAVIHKRPGKTKYKNLTLRVGQGAGTTLFKWRDSVMAGSTDRKSGSVIYLDREGNELARYRFTDAWPCRWSASAREPAPGGFTVEEVQLCAVDVTLVQ